jgi:hypothetical protein
MYPLFRATNHYRIVSYQLTPCGLHCVGNHSIAAFEF